MTLGRQRIIEELAKGRIYCDPMPRNIEATHFDLHLGNYWWQLRPEALGMTFDVENDDPALLYELHNAEEGDGHIYIPAGGMILAHSIEAAGSRCSNIQPFIETRSTAARLGFTAHTSAGWGDPGFHGIWTFEMKAEHPITLRIPVGARVASIAFNDVDKNDLIYGAEENPRYNYDRSRWRPEHMLPRKNNFL